MKIKNNSLQVLVDDKGQIKKIIFNNINVLYDMKTNEKPIYFMAWPIIGFSNGFEIDNKNFLINKNGFWNKLNWNKAYENNSITMFATHFANKTYPFSIDIQQNISINNNKIIIHTLFSNLSKVDAYFNFGHCPIFKIDDNSIIESVNDTPQIIDLKGKLKKEQVKINKISNLKFGTKYKSIVYKKNNHNTFLKNSKYTIKISSLDFNTIQIWKPKYNKVICIQPCQGYEDSEYDAPKKANKKLDIIKLESGKIKSFEVSYTFYKN